MEEEPNRERPSHDGFVRRLLSHHEVAEAQLRWLLPAPLVERLDWSTLRQGPTDTVNVVGKTLRSDVVFDVRTRSGQPLLVHVLFEHQRQSDPLMALRMVEYRSRIWRHAVDAGGPPLPIVPVVLYNGTRRWRAPTAIETLIPTPADWSVDAVELRGGFLLCDLSVVPDDEIHRRAVHAHLRLGLLVLKHASRDDFWARFLGWAAVLVDVWTLPQGRDRVDAILHYLLRAAPSPSKEVRRSVIRILPTNEGEMITWAETVELDTRRKMLAELLQVRFGALPTDVVERLGSASVEQLSVWGQRMINAELTLRDIFDETNGLDEA